ncbi:MAG: monooxygenase [Rhodospirillaceae bacterium]|jgi:2-polyprenyl-6-methoxyphenol hydroxylase-like FAD-dependent oxidoreductase|nr:monooxygenase [Rhodospirillaceae bacterium]MBT4588434.1 monooxygenase [Rhodospirillaceae bacterium]MBT5938843.1 monooxygenase [Rhodospirillaceae bacterium]MBT7267561.1 monooxygenase [Rhodospirillaceae bacterium]
MSKSDFPVLISGGGPVGLCLSMELSTRGVPHLLVNARSETPKHPKGSTINSRTMEHLRRYGAGPVIRQTGLPENASCDSTYVSRVSGYELGRIPMPTLKEKTSNPGPWGETTLTPEPIHRSNQMYFEAVMKSHAESFDQADIRFGWELVSFEDQGDQVVAEIKNLSSGETEAVTADYLAGCDGAQGMIRRQLGFKYEGRQSTGDRFYDGSMASIYARSPMVKEVRNMKDSWHYWTINPEGRTDFISLNGDDEFLLLSEVPPDLPFDQVDAEEIFRIAVGATIDVEIISVQEWLAGLAMVTDHYQKGRVVLAGDSVHLFTPSGGFGFNTGIDDAANIGWKLAAMVEGFGGENLIDSYEIERRPIGVRNTATSGQYADKIGSLQFPDFIEEDSGRGKAARDVLRVDLASFKEEFASLGIVLGARYDGSPLIVSDGSQPPPDDPAKYIPSATPGGRLPHYWIGDKDSIFDLLGPWFNLLRIGPEAPESTAIEQVARDLNMPLNVVDVEKTAAQELYQAKLLLVRPDQHVAWRSNAVPEDISAILGAIIGR